jgi:hypothetical protein
LPRTEPTHHDPPPPRAAGARAAALRHQGVRGRARPQRHPGARHQSGGRSARGCRCHLAAPQPPAREGRCCCCLEVHTHRRLSWSPASPRSSRWRGSAWALHSDGARTRGGTACVRAGRLAHADATADGPVASADCSRVIDLRGFALWAGGFHDLGCLSATRHKAVKHRIDRQRSSAARSESGQEAAIERVRPSAPCADDHRCDRCRHALKPSGIRTAAHAAIEGWFA